MNKISFFDSLKNRRVAVCGIGKNNVPVIFQLLEHGAYVIACDCRTRDQLGNTASKLESAKVKLRLGSDYLNYLEHDGVDLILRTPGMKPYLEQFESARRRGIVVTSEMELFFSLCPAHITAVTGSDGKTTTTTIIAGILTAAGYRVHVGGNIGRPLLPILNNILPDDRVVVELSSFQLTGMTQSPNTAVITNIAPNHLDWHTDMSEYINAKKNLIQWQTADDCAVLNADNQYTAQFADKAKAQVSLFSRNIKPRRGAWLSPEGQLIMTADGVDVPVIDKDDILLPGTHNTENYLAAISAVWGGVSPEIIAEFARSFAGVPHRCELVRELDGVKWYNDSIGTSPSRTIAGLKAFKQKVILIAGGYDKHISYQPLGSVVAKTVKEAILMGDTADTIEKVIKECSDVCVQRVNSMEQAVETAKKIALNGDIVFMSPASASFDSYKNFEERGEHFRRLVMSLN